MDRRAAMHRLECTDSRSDTERATNADCAGAGHYKLGSISAATIGGAMTSRMRSRWWWGRLQDGKRADANMCRFLSCVPRRNVTKRWWTSWPQLTSASSRHSKWTTNSVLIVGTFSFVDPFCSGSIATLSFVKGVAAGNSGIWLACLEAEVLFLDSVIL